MVVMVERNQIFCECSVNVVESGLSLPSMCFLRYKVYGRDPGKVVFPFLLKPTVVDICRDHISVLIIVTK